MVSNIEKIFDNVTITASGGTSTATFTIDRADQNVAIFMDADVNGASLDVDFYVDPDDDKVNQFFHDVNESVSGQDATEGVVLRPTLQPMDQVQVTLTNQGAADTVVSAWVKPYQK